MSSFSRFLSRLGFARRQRPFQLVSGSGHCAAVHLDHGRESDQAVVRVFPVRRSLRLVVDNAKAVSHG